MTALRPAELPGWPRGLPEDLAAAYVGISVTNMRRLMQSPRTPFPGSVELSPQRVVWLREDLDRWLDAKAGRVPASQGPDAWMTR
jgi:predicted DNA-binding transcriptional regulator AlpA